MTKKYIALFLALLMALSLPLTAFAAAADAPAENKLNGFSDALAADIAPAAQELVVDADGDALAGIVAAYTDGTDTTTATLADFEAAGLAPAANEIVLPAPDAQTVGDAADAMKKYIFMKVEDPAALAALIADSCNFSYSLVEDDKGTVYIQVDIEKNPQIFNYEVFRAVVDELYAREKEEMVKNNDGSVNYLMSYEHIAGELALHAIMYAATNEIIRLTGTGSSTIVKLYNAARSAELNYDESRLPGNVIAAFGKLILTFIRWNIFKILTVFG